MQANGVEIKKRKLSLRNAKTSKNGSFEAGNSPSKCNIPLVKTDPIKVDAVDVVNEDSHEKLSDKRWYKHIYKL